MKSKLKKVAISFLITLIIYHAFSFDALTELGFENAHSGLFFVLGLLFGPYGAIGAVLGDSIISLCYDTTSIGLIISEITTFGVSYLAYKLWYSGFKTDKVTKPRLDNIYHLTLFLSIIVICALIFSAVHAHITGFVNGREYDQYYFISYFLNFVNTAFIFGILGIWLSKKIDLIEIPKISKKTSNKKFYRLLFYLLIIVSIIASISLLIDYGLNLAIFEISLITILLFAYLTKPFEYNIQQNDKNTIIESIIRNFLIITLTIAIVGVIISVLSFNYLETLNNANIYLLLMPTLIITDVVLILFFIPGIIILRYIERKVIKPISSFSEIESFIEENEKIEAEGLVNIYSKYVNENSEIGTLARSYTDLINHNNNYIENIQKIEGEKERIKTELDIATKIQAANLPIEAIENDDFIVNGYSHPAKEVGGDFFDYYMIDDDNLAIVIGDASGKGVPAALIAMITQVTLKEMLNHIQNPTEVLYRLNNKLCENNTESMFLTLWLGIYNKTSGKLTFSNAGHNPPLIKENNKFEYLNINSGIVLGIMEDFDFVKEEIGITDKIILYTDGITDAKNEDNEMYGEDSLLNFFNEFKNEKEPIKPLLDDINQFTLNEEQYDDMTLLYLKRK